ncbi:MAG: Spy/CpxP family protein refolding chaperone [Acidobacteria bacterium]|nr:Spy/CpxP family protein refolding chaperone [Acidobacteriota bacterium]
MKRRAVWAVAAIAVAGLLVETGAYAQTAPPAQQPPKAQAPAAKKPAADPTTQAQPTPPPAPQPPMGRGPGMGRGQMMGRGLGLGRGQMMGRGMGMGPMQQGRKFGRQQMARRSLMGAAGMAGLMRRLNLTQAQKDQLKGFRDQRQKDMTATRDKLQPARQKLRDAMRAQIPDEAAVRAAGLAMATAQADQMALQARSRAQLMKVLTPEQQQQFRQFQQRMTGGRSRQMRMQPGGMMDRQGKGWRRRD